MYNILNYYHGGKYLTMGTIFALWVNSYAMVVKYYTPGYILKHRVCARFGLGTKKPYVTTSWVGVKVRVNDIDNKHIRDRLHI